MLEIAALLSRGRRIPTGEKGQAPCNVIFQGTEDGQADSIKPRLIKADADCSRIAFIDAPDDSGLSLGDSRFRSAIQRTSARLLVIDPLQGFLHTGSETNKAGSLRNMFTRLAGIAEETGCAIVLIGHMNKNNNGKGIYRGLGSPFLSVIYKTCRWDPALTYLSFGKVYGKNRLVEFDLKAAATIAPEQFVDPGV